MMDKKSGALHLAESGLRLADKIQAKFENFKACCKLKYTFDFLLCRATCTALFQQA